MKRPAELRGFELATPARPAPRDHHTNSFAAEIETITMLMQIARRRLLGIAADGGKHDLWLLIYAALDRNSNVTGFVEKRVINGESVQGSEGIEERFEPEPRVGDSFAWLLRIAYCLKAPSWIYDGNIFFRAEISRSLIPYTRLTSDVNLILDRTSNVFPDYSKPEYVLLEYKPDGLRGYLPIAKQSLIAAMPDGKDHDV